MKKKNNILIVTYWGFNSGILHSYALPYVRLIRKINNIGTIHLCTLTPSTGDGSEKFDALKEKLLSEGIVLVNYTYKPFGISMALRFVYIFASLFKLVLQKKINFIHAWCTPGGAIGYILSLFTGNNLVLDSFEPHAETMVETRTWSKKSVAFNLLFALEKLQLKRASHVICAAEGMPEYSQQTYGVTKDHYFVKPACVDLELFKPMPKQFSLIPDIRAEDIVCVYVGKFGDIYLKEEVFEFFKVAQDYWGKKFKVLLLTNHSDEEINLLCRKAGLNSEAVLKYFVDHIDVPKYMSLGTFGICPVNPVPTKQYCTPIKNGEYWAMGLPVVITKNISTDSFVIEQNNIGYVLKQLNSEEYLNAVEKMEKLRLNEMLPEQIRTIAERYRNYEIAIQIYRGIYENSKKI